MKPGDSFAERFEIQQLAGRGAMGDVYRAVDRTTNQVIALKVLRAQQEAQEETTTEHFAREARVLADMKHPGIVGYIAHGHSETGEPFLALEWLEGDTLGKRLKTGGLTLLETVTLGRKVAEALGYAHRRGVVHRDVKPSNLFLPDDEIDQVKLLDFGIARLELGTRITSTGVLVGTPGYMAPEQARGEIGLDARADVFALGCVLYRCLTGKPAFVGDHMTAVLAKILFEEGPRVRESRPNVPIALDDLVARMLSKDRSARPADGNAVLAELDRISDLVRGFEGDEAMPESVVQAAPVLTTSEQRLVSVVMAVGARPAAANAARAAQPAEEQATLDAPSAMRRNAHTKIEARPRWDLPQGALAPSENAAPNGSVAAVTAAVAPFGARLEHLADGSLVATLTGRWTATDQAAQAARCALAMRASLPGAPLVLATGRGVLGDRLPVGEVIDRAATMLREAKRMGMAQQAAKNAPSHENAPPALGAIYLDELTAGLLDARFDIGGDVRGLQLRGERATAEGSRTLLGKPSPCVGRDRELGVLSGIFDESVAEELARAVLVTGPAGVGKSRVRDEFLRRLRQRDDQVEIWVGRGDPMSAGSPFGMLAQAIRGAAGLLAGEALELQQKKLRARVSRHVKPQDQPRVTEFLGELIGVPFPDDDSVQLRAARQDAMLLGDQMRRAWEDFLEAESRARPVVLVLEDLHWGDVPTVKLVDSALRSLENRPFMLLAVARPDVLELFPNLWADRSLTHMRLTELPRKASERLIRETLGSDAPPETVARLAEHAAGNPFFLEELIRAVVEGRGEALPGTVLAMVEARLQRLEPETRQVLRAASVFGQVFWERGVQSLLSGEFRGAMLTESLSKLVDREIVTRRPEAQFPGESEYIFRHNLVREGAYAMLTESDRKLGHRLVGAWLETAGSNDAMVLAEHFERGGESERAVKWYARAVEQVFGGNDLGAVPARVERAVLCGATDEVLGELRLFEAEARRWRGENTEGMRAGLDALTRLAPGTSRWFAAAGEVSITSTRLGNKEQLIAACRVVRETPPADRDAQAACVVTSARMVVHLCSSGIYDESDLMLAKIDEVAPSLGDSNPAVVAAVHSARAMRALVGGDPAAYLERLEAAAPEYERAGDVRNACNTQTNIGFASMELGAYAQAERALRGALAMAQQMGLLNVLNNTKHNLGYALANLGILEEARAVESDAIEAFKAQGDPRMEGVSRVYLATIHMLGGALDQAEEEARTAVALVENKPPARAFALATLAKVLLVRERNAEALDAAQQAMALLESLGGMEEGEAIVRVAHAEALLAAGDHAAASRAIEAAHKRLLERAEQIQDPTWRESFLTKVPAHAQTLELAARWAGKAA